MSDSLTTLTGKIQNLLGDASAAYFTTAICTAALRSALDEFNRRAPRQEAVLITGVNDQYEYELSDEDANALSIFDVLLRGDGGNELDESLDFDQYTMDERLYFRLRSPVAATDTLIVYYGVPHTINGLDSQVESTIQAVHDQVLVYGGCYYALNALAISRIQTINLNKDVSDNYKDFISLYRRQFDEGLRTISRRKSAVGEPDVRAWNDDYHTWGQ